MLLQTIMETQSNSYVDDDKVSHTNSIVQPDSEGVPTSKVFELYPSQQSSGHKLPPIYNYTYTLPGISQPGQQSNTIIQSTPSVTLATTQPRIVLQQHPSTRAANEGEQLFFLSMFLCIFCAICGSPLTLACFVPAMFLSQKVCVIILAPQ